MCIYLIYHLPFCVFFFSDKKEMRDSSSSSISEGLNVTEEYLGALRTNSYLEFFTKVQSLVMEEPTSSSLSFCQQRFSEVLLEPKQDTIQTLLESSSLLSRKSDLKVLFINYFDISAEASKVCSHILRSINELVSHNKFINKILETSTTTNIFDNNINFSSNHLDSRQLQFIFSEFMSSIIFHEKNPLSDLNLIKDFIRIHDKYSSVLNHLKSKRKKIARRAKLMNYLKKASSTALFMTVGVPDDHEHQFKKKYMCSTKTRTRTRRFHHKKCGSTSFLMRKVGEQLDVAAKGTYILNRDFDTISRLVRRVHDEIEHNKEMMKLCLDRREDRFSLQVLMKELKKSSDFGFRKRVEELEELSLIHI